MSFSCGMALLMLGDACAPAVQREAPPSVVPCSPPTLAGEDRPPRPDLNALLLAADLPRNIRQMKPTKAPRLLNPQSVEKALVRNYPRDLRDRGIGGSVAVHILVDPTGQPAVIRIAESSGLQGLDKGSLVVAGTMRFDPARLDECGIYSIVEVPIVFRAR